MSPIIHYQYFGTKKAGIQFLTGKEKENMANGKAITLNTYSNPFDDVNANVLDAKKIVKYWCSPFAKGPLDDLDELRFRTSKMPIIVQGARGSGKTTILKYFSIEAQKARAKEEKKKYIDIIKEEKEVGFYFRCDYSFVSTFEVTK